MTDPTSSANGAHYNSRLLTSMLAETDAPAFHIGNQTWSRAQFAQHSRRLAAGLAAAGVQPGDRVALHLENGPEIMVAYLACFRIGAIAVAMYPRYEGAELESMLRRIRPAIYIGHPTLYQRVEPIAADVLSPSRRFVVGGSADGSARPWTILHQATPAAPHRDVDAHAPAVLIATSGTTGQPKLVAHSQASLAGLAKKAPFREIRPGQRMAFSLQMSQMSGLSHIMGGLFNDAMMVVVDPIDTAGMLDTIQKQHCTYLAAVPAVLKQIIGLQRREPRDVNSLRFCIALADVCEPSLQSAFEAVFGLPLRTMWSSTEAAGSLTYGLLPGAVSRLVPGTELRLVDADGRKVMHRERGEMLLRADNVALGYWRGPGEWGGFPDGWCPTGDLMRNDKDHNLWFEGRVKDLIERNRVKISPVEVERALARHPAVADAGVTSRPDPILGHRVVALAQLADGTNPDRLDDIRQSMIKHLTADTMPDGIAAVSKVPRTPAGKLDRKELAISGASEVCNCSVRVGQKDIR